ncbi:hypothetical protein Pelo_1095 [Pelomyxa schiedti]|nr:hypothetical protein Pelo_1095 [Pelomyxa schiedti]
MSLWNQVGGNWTWEERDYSKWGRERLKQLLTSPQKQFAGTFTVESSLESAEATLLFLHGKKRPGYEFEDVKLKFTCTEGGLVIKGLVVCPCISSNESWEIRASLDKGFEPNEDLLRRVRAAVRECVQQFGDELNAKLP